MNENASTLLQLWRSTMRAKRRTEQEQYEIIMECRQSGLSDHQWCLEHDINPVNLSSLRPYEVRKRGINNTIKECRVKKSEKQK